MKFEYDKKKWQATLKKQRLDFNDAVTVFEGPRRITWQDTRQEYGEVREITMGELVGRLVIIVHTKRNSAIRISP